MHRPLLLTALLCLPLSLTRSAAALTKVKQIDVRQTYEGEGGNAVHYYIVFHGRGGSLTGHAYVTWGESDKPEETWGFYPKDTSLAGEAASITGTPGELRDDTKSIPADTQRLMVRVDAKQYKASRTVLDRYRTRPPLVLVHPGFVLGSKDCIDFVYEVGRSFDLAMPDRSRTVFPEEYIGELMEDIDRDYTVPLPNGNSYYGKIMLHPDDTMGYTWLNGKGAYTTKTGTVIVGNFHYGRVEGMGEMRDSGGASFEGNFVDGTPHNGTWRDHGQAFGGVKGRGSEPTVGTLFFPNGDMYSGNFSQDGRRNGQGVYRFKSDGSSWDGTWSDDMVTGRVKVSFPDGASAVISQTSPGLSLNGPMTYTDRTGRVGIGNWGPGGWKVDFPDRGSKGEHHEPHDHWERPEKTETGLKMGPPEYVH